ncbi:MA2A2-like protein [Mya arenaria]|uniref:MA2A2-like protein n=1 Tax=Mya arenaria TaxID=6604 RepID=A0ABY7FJ05_MYAAR|nr:MA2A2-like protein [Mya arenaria]
MNDVLDNLKEADTTVKSSTSSSPVGSKNKQKPYDGALDVIVIPHSHNDPGWKKTYQQYYEDQTSQILSLIVEKLYEYPDMTFIWVESCFLDTWWENQTVDTQQKFRALVKSGRLEITSGMWVAPDEASPHYFALLDQMIEGHYWVKKNLGVVPESSLNFDQFGYSATMPYFVKRAGLKNVLIKRIHRAVKELFGRENKLNFHWRQLWDPSGKDDIFAHVEMYEWMSTSDSCGPIRAVCNKLDFLNEPDLEVADAPKPPAPPAARVSDGSQNMHDFTQTLVEQFRLKNANYKYKVMMLPHGGDFRYDTPFEWDKQYRNLKRFMKYVNDNTKLYNVKMHFGTLKDYFYEIERQNIKYDIKYPTVTGDFFTYTENTEYWTGYFTTRQFDKRLGREVLESLRAAELFTSLAFTCDIPSDVRKEMIAGLVIARKNLGIFQHHDAITGTSQEHVAKDYEELLTIAFSKTQRLDWRQYIGFGGAYTMISNGNNQQINSKHSSVKFVSGGLFCGVEITHDVFSYSISLTNTNSAIGRALRVDILSDLLSMPNFVGDLAMRVVSNINSNGTFFVDSNGFQMMGRKYRANIPFDGNVYPMSSMSILEDSKRRLVVHSAQPHGVITSGPGVIDFMIDRVATRPEMDMPEPVKDNKPTLTSFYIEVLSSDEFEHSATYETTLPTINSIYLNDLLQHPIYGFYADGSLEGTATVQSFLKTPLSCDVILANVKNLAYSSDNVSDGTSLTLFRRAAGCHDAIDELIP